MQPISSLAFCVFMTVCSLQNVHGANKSDYYGLYNYLFSDNFYKKEVRPVEDGSTAVFVYMELSLMALVDVNEKDQVLKTSVRLEVYWSDGVLSWIPGDYGSIETLMVPQKNIWLPDIVLANGVTAQSRLGYDELPVRLTYSGDIDWEPSVLLATSCSIVITYFPFDTQECQIEFQTALSGVAEVDINIDTTYPITLDQYSEDGQWQLESTSAQNLNDEGGKSKIRYTIVLSRRRTFYLIYIIMPIFFLSLTSSLIFLLPPDEGEKTGTGITVVLAFAVYLTIVADQVPNTSLQVSILGVYLISLLGLSALSLIVCVYIIRVHFRDSTREVGPKTTQIVMILRKMTCMSQVGSSRNIVTPLNNGRDVEDHESTSGKPNGIPHVDHGVFLEEKITWQVASSTYDWFCFIFFSGSTIMATIVTMMALEFGSKSNAPGN